ncbi:MULTISPECIES: hypothetical protein [unclassified Oceanobacillus]
MDQSIVPLLVTSYACPVFLMLGLNKGKQKEADRKRISFFIY